MTTVRSIVTAGLFPLAFLVLWGCPPPGEEEPESPGQEEEVDEPAEEADSDATVVARSQEARAEMVDSAGGDVGTVHFETVESVEVHVQGSLHVAGLEPGPKGIHVHEEGECEPPDFESAGGHFDPHGSPHGGPDDPPGERHVGDLGNVEAGPDGGAEIAMTDTVITLEDRAENIRHRSLVLHAEEDDLTTDPDGNAGDRVACGVIR